MLYFLLIVLGIITRLLPHPPNLTAIAAVALYSGYYLKNRKIGFLFPLLIMLLTDIKIGFYQWQLMLSVYLSFVIITVLGIFLEKKNWLFALPGSMIGSIIFFLITNWAVWQFTPWYPHNLAGLFACYLAGLPFLKNQFLGDIFYTAPLFSLTEGAKFLARNQNKSLKKFLFLQE